MRPGPCLHFVGGGCMLPVCCLCMIHVLHLLHTDGAISRRRDYHSWSIVYKSKSRMCTTRACEGGVSYVDRAIQNTSLCISRSSLCLRILRKGLMIIPSTVIPQFYLLTQDCCSIRKSKTNTQRLRYTPTVYRNYTR